MELLPLGLNHHELWPTPESHLFRDATHLLLRCGHRNALAALGPSTTKDLATTAGLLTSTEAVRALTALVVWLVGTLRHDGCSRDSERSGIDTRVCTPSQGSDDPSRTAPDSSSRNWAFRSSIRNAFCLQSEIAICYQRQVFSCGQVVYSAAGVLQKRL